MGKPENSEPENFLTRWSSRKRASRTPPAREDAEHAAGAAKGAVEDVAVANAVAKTQNKTEKTGKECDAQDNPPFDLAQLPSLDSIGPNTDVAAFLRKDVPADLARAALRRAWTSDPAIKNFVGLVENGWDFNDPTAIGGFGPISAEEVARLAGKVIEALPNAANKANDKAAPEDQIADAAASERKSQAAHSNALPAGPLEDAPQTTEPGRGSGDDAAQQSETGTKA
ncbi:MAG: DUF3306 domain-containing protein [Rhizobiales bacterium]|nr:DUF3306 domain-containing protein [Hyphomicrobiales bacterium]